MRYTYIFTQISREENGESVPVTDKPYEFVFSFGNTIDKVLGKSADSDNTVLITKDMWKEHPTKNEEILQTVCFSASSNQGFRRPLVMTKDADHRAGLYKYEEVIAPIDLKKDQYLSDDIRRLTEIFVTGIRAINEPAKAAPWENLGEANVKHKMSYITSEVYKHLLQDKDNRGKIRSEAFLKKVLEDFFSIIPDSLIDKFDEGLKAHDKIRERLEGVPKNNEDTISAILQSQGYFGTNEDFELFVALHKYILSVKNNFNHLVWVLYRSKIGMVSLKNVKKQLSGMFDFEIKVQDICEPLENTEILKKICGGDRYITVVGDFLRRIYDLFSVKDLNKAERAALCYKFHNECNLKYFDSKFKYYDELADEYKPFRQEQFRDLCLLYWGIVEDNTYRPSKCLKQMEKFSSLYYNKEVWGPMKK